MYLVNNYDRLAQEYADAGMSVMFTGHMHAVDIAAKTTDAGNTIYDIETGSGLTIRLRCASWKSAAARMRRSLPLARARTSAPSAIPTL